MNKLHIVLLSALLVPVGATSADLDLELGGFIWTDVGTGDRYDGSDDDQTGVSKAGITVSTSVDNVSASLTLGVDGMINHCVDCGGLGSNGSGDDLEVKEAWIAFDFDWADVTIGKQALGFGLKPAGWVGGRPINDGLEFGGSSLDVNSSGQVVTGIAADMAVGDFTLRGVMFDSESAGADDSMTDNWMLQLRSDDLFGSGFYASAGYEEVTVAGGLEIEGTSIGAGYDLGWADISLEHQDLDSVAVEGEFMIIAATVPLSDDYTLYLDYADGEIYNTDITDTTRIGVTHAYNDNVDVTLEWSDDNYEQGFDDDTSSVDLRIALSFE